MKLKLILLVLASATALASTPASARYYRHGYYHHFGYYGSYHRYYSNPSAPGGGMLSPSAAWNGSSPGSGGAGP